MTITAHSLKDFLDITYGLVARGITFEAVAENSQTFVITLTGGF